MESAVKLVAQILWSRLELHRILWFHTPSPAISDSHSGWKYLYFDASYVASSELSTLGSQIIVDPARDDLVWNLGAISSSIICWVASAEGMLSHLLRKGKESVMIINPACTKRIR